MDGGLKRGRAIMMHNGLTSLPAACLPIRCACSGVVPRPMNGSATVSPGSVYLLMKYSGSCGLKHAR